MAVSAHGVSRIFAGIAAAVGIISILLAAIGLATPEWQTTYTHTGGNTQITTTSNFFYACTYTSGTLNQCFNRNESFTGYPGATAYVAGIYSRDNDTNTRFNSASALTIVGIGLTAGGVVSTLLLICLSKFAILIFLAPVVYLLGTLFMLVGLAEGARVLVYNGYSANLYEVGHMMSIFGFGMCCIAATRFHTLKSV